MTLKKILLLFLIPLFFSNCNLEPRYRRPSMELPCTWRIESDEGSTLANVRWWECLQDPILNALIIEALQNNYDLKVAIARVCEFFAQYQIVKSKLYPQVNLEGSVLKQKISQHTTFVPPNFDPITPFYSYDFTLSYELDFWGKISSQAHAAYSEALSAVETKRSVILTLVSSLAQAYINLREFDRELEISTATLKERAEYLRLAILRFEGGLTSEIEVTQAQSVYDQTRAQITLLNERIPQQENLISVLIGRSPTCILRGSSITALQMPFTVPAGLPSELLLRRPDILSAEDKLIAANAEIGAARAAFFPQITLTGLFGGESFQLKNLFSAANRAWHIGLNFVQPIFTGGRLTGELKVAWARQREALFTYHQTVLNAFKEVNDALIALRQSKELVLVEEDRVKATQHYLYLSWLRYYEGETDYLTVLDAQRQYFDSQIELTKAQGDVFNSLVELYKALGGGWVLDADCNLSPQTVFCPT